MDERMGVFLSALAGALAGAVVGYILFTESGRRLRAQLEPRLDSAMKEMGHIRETVAKAQAVASEGWRSISEITGKKGGDGQRGEWGGTTQSSPF